MTPGLPHSSPAETTTASTRQLQVLLALSILALALGLASCSNSSSGFFGSGMSVVESFPTSGSRNVSPTTVVSVNFSSAVDPGSVTANTVRIRGSESGTPSGVYRVVDRNRKVEFLLETDTRFTPGEFVTVTVTSGVIAQGGGSSEGFSFQFRITETDPDANPAPVPAVTSYEPAPWTTDASPSTTIRIELDEPLDASTVDADAVGVRGTVSGTIPATVSLSGSGLVLTIDPDDEFHPQEIITVSLADSLRSREDQVFPGHSYSFQVRSEAHEPTAGGLRRGPDVVIGDPIARVRAGDLDRDGLLDLVVATTTGTRLELLRGLGEGEFVLQAPVEITQAILDFILVDIDGNGWLDLAVSTADRIVLIQLESVGGSQISFSTEPVSVPVADPVRSLVAGELDHRDLEHPDFVLDTDGGFRIHLSGLGEAPHQEIGTTRLARTPPVLLDLGLNFPDDQIEFLPDGWTDLAYGALAGDALSVSRFDPDTLRLDVPTNLTLPSDARQLLIGDRDRDGEVDLITLTPLSGGGEFIQEVPTSTGGSSLPVPGVLPTLGPSSLNLVDLDGDGWLDLLHVNADSARIRLLRGGPDVDSLNGPYEDLWTGVPISELLAHDFTGDGKIDLVGVAGDRLVTLMTERPAVSGEATITLGDLTGPQGATGIDVPVTLTSDQDLAELTLLIGFDAASLLPTGVDFTGSALEAAGVEFTHFDLFPAEGEVVVQVNLEASAPDDGRVLPAGTDLDLFLLGFDIPALAPVGQTALELLDSATATTLVSRIEDALGNPVTPLGVSGVVTVQLNSGGSTVNSLSLDAPSLERGALDRRVPVILNSEAALDGLTVTVAHDPLVLFPLGVQIDGGLLEGVPLFFENIQVDEVEGFITYSTVLDPTVTDNVIPPSTDQTLLRLAYDVLETAAIGTTTLEFVEDSAIPALNTLLLSGGAPVSLLAETGSIEITEPVQLEENTLTLTPLEATQGDEDLLIEGRLAHESPVERLTVILDYDPAALEVVDFDLAGTASEPLAPLINTTIDPVYGEATIDLLFRSVLGGQSLPPAADDLVFRIRVNIPGSAPAGEHVLALVETSREGDVSARLLSGGSAAPLMLVDSTLTVEALPPVDNPNKLRLEDRFAMQGQTDVRSTVYATTDGALEAFTIIGRYPSGAITNLRLEHDGTPVAPFGPELILEEISPVDGTFTHTVFLDNSPVPGEERTIPAGADLPLVHFIYDVPVDALVGDYQITFENLRGDQTSPNSFVFDEGDGVSSRSAYPARTPGDVIIGVPQEVFVRGDVDGSGTIGHADYQALLAYLNLGSPVPACLDTADVDDSGEIDSADYLALLGFVFSGSPAPLPPFEGNPAPDPTPDALDCQSGI